MKSTDIVIRIDRKAAVALAALGLLTVAALKLYSESLTVTASYPSPVGIYNQLVTTGDSGAAPADTTFNRNAGNTILVPPTNAAGSVGVGTISPAAKLDVAGGARVQGAVKIVGTLQLQDGSQAVGKVLTSDANGLASWGAATGGFGGGYCTKSGSGAYSISVRVNPMTGANSCPTGYTRQLFFATGGLANCNGDCGVLTCYLCY